MPYRDTDKGIFLTPRRSGENASIEILFTSSSTTQRYIIEGRFNGWQTGVANGYLYFLNGGTIKSGYAAALVEIRDVITDQAVNAIIANRTYKLSLSGIPANRVISMFCTRYSIAEYFTGKIHSIKCTNWYMGGSNAGTDSENGGLRSDLHIQIDRILDNSNTPSMILRNKHLGYVAPEVIIQTQEGWTNSDDLRNWTGSTNTTLLLGDPTNNAVNGSRTYHRLMKFTADIQLNGNTGSLEWQRPQNSARHTASLTEGANEIQIVVRLSTLPRLTFSSAAGVVISNMKLVESQDCLIQIATWTERAI